MSVSKNQKENDEELVWYLSYGSNLLEERFLCYIEGGTPPGSKSFHSGSRFVFELLVTFIFSLLYFSQKEINENQFNQKVVF